MQEYVYEFFKTSVCKMDRKICSCGSLFGRTENLYGNIKMHYYLNVSQLGDQITSEMIFKKKGKKSHHMIMIFTGDAYISFTRFHRLKLNTTGLFCQGARRLKHLKEIRDTVKFRFYDHLKLRHFIH